MSDNPIIDPGKYRAHPLRAMLGISGTGKEQVAVTFVIPDENMSEVTWYGYFTEATEARTLQSLRYCGWTSDNLAECEHDIDGETFYGPIINEEADVQLVIEHDEYNGKVSAKVQWVNGPSRAVLKQGLDANQAKAFAAKMRGAAVASKVGSGSALPAAPKPSAPRSQPERLESDPIPF